MSDVLYGYETLLVTLGEEYRLRYFKQYRQCTYNIEARSCHHCCSGKAMSIT